MLSSVYIAGRMGETLDEGVRIVEVDGCVPGPDGAFSTFAIPVYSNMAKGSYFFQAPKGSLIIVKGRLEVKAGLGLVVVNEIDEIYSSKIEVHKTTFAEE